MADDVHKRYDGGVSALRGTTLRVTAGELVALTGPSGCGKSTLLNVIGGLDEPDAGSVRIDGHPPGAARFRRETIGFVFQAHHLVPVLTAAANVELPLIASGIGRRERAQRARELLAEVGLEAAAERLPPKLSGGERQRVAVARALANRPRLLLADEPTGALDIDNSTRVLDLLVHLRDTHGMTVIVVSHDLAIGERADRLERMADGRIVRPPTPLGEPADAALHSAE